MLSEIDFKGFKQEFYRILSISEALDPQLVSFNRT